jgi:hypothetical protein
MNPRRAISWAAALAVVAFIVAGPGRPAAAAPAGGRAYEMVTPVAKNGGDVGAGLGSELQSALGQSSAEGEAIAYASTSSFAGSASAEVLSQYVSRREPGGWSTEAISPPTEVGGGRELSSLAIYRAFSTDLSTGLLEWGKPVLVPAAPTPGNNLYLHGGGVFTLLTPRPFSPTAGTYEAVFAGATPDLSHVLFETSVALTANAQEGPRSLYEWTLGAGVRLVSVLPGPEELGAGGAGSGDGGNDNFTDVISTDGSRVFWTDGLGDLYVRLDGTRTVQLNVSRLAGGEDGTARFLAATPNGSKALFVDPDPLLEEPGDKGGGIYQYEVETGAMRDLTPDPSGSPEIEGILGMSEDGSTVYFVAAGVLAAGASPGSPNLYVERGGAVSFVATLSGGDFGDWASGTENHMARVAADGAVATFLSRQPLTGYDNRGPEAEEPVSEVYVYSIGSGLVCVSCDPSGARPDGPAGFPLSPTQSYLPRVLSSDGSRLFFDSPDQLVPADTNRRVDIYEYSGGRLSLISAGTGSTDSHLIDASATGRDVFFATRSRLVGADVDEASDIYDARIGGGFATEPTELPCGGEACRGPLASPPAAATTVTLVPPENGAPVKHRKHKRAKAKRAKARAAKAKAARARAARSKLTRARHHDAGRSRSHGRRRSR